MLEMDTPNQEKCIENLQSSLDAISPDYVKSMCDLIYDEHDYIRELHMIIKIYREKIAKLVQNKNKLDIIFSNITDIYETTVTILGSLEDAMEIGKEQQMPTAGSCFEELAEAKEFDVYIRYARDINSPASREIWTNLLSRPESSVILREADYSLSEAVKYYLPKLLLQPILHCLLYFDYIRVLHMYTPSIEDGTTLEKVQGMLSPLQNKLMESVTSFPKNVTCSRIQSKERRQAAKEKIQNLQKTVDGWDQIDNWQCGNELIREDTLEKVNGQKLTKRRAILFDGLLILCKPNSKGASIVVNDSAVGADRYPRTPQEFRLKEKFFIRKVDIIDIKDTEELKNAFEISSKNYLNDITNVTLIAKSAEDKNNWMADLVMLNTKSMLEKTLDSILLDEEEKHPVTLPPVYLYKFAEQDSEENIILDDKEKDVPLVKSATLEKLIERVTYHTYVDPNSLKTLLITYRSFCSPQELLTLLIDRFNIPLPLTVYDGKEKLSCKRYRKEFCQPVQFRVLNVLRQWVNHHFYDFERDTNLLNRLLSFLNNKASMRKWVDSLLKIVKRKSDPSVQQPIQFIFGGSFPPIETHLTIPESNKAYGILTIHPIEFARQLTLLEFELFRKIRPSELIGCVWTKEDKERTSPNLIKMIKHTTNFTRWLEKIIVEAQNFEERKAVVSRAIEIMKVLEDLNNFNGVVAIVSAMESASVHRLKLTFQSLPAQLTTTLENARELGNDHFRKYEEKLRSINPPCVPFLGMHLTNILHIEEGNPDYLPKNSTLINFSKLQKIVELIGKIQQYQNQPYCLLIESKIRQYIENTCLFDSMSDENIETYLYNQSLEIEPRGIEEPIEFPRKWFGVSLVSPGINAKGHLLAIQQSINYSPYNFDAMDSALSSPSCSSKMPMSCFSASSVSTHLLHRRRESLFSRLSQQD